MSFILGKQRDKQISVSKSLTKSNKNNEKLTLTEKPPMFPPYLDGYNIYTVDAIMETQHEILKRIRLEAGVQQYDKYYEECIRNYCEFVHLLPASEADHHKGRGGLFRHGLEVALYTLLFSKHKLFDTHLPPSERIENEPRWHFAAFVSGLLHDIGKPVTDYTVYCQENEAEWSPYMGLGLYEWAVKNNVAEYHIRWADGRHKKHEALSGSLTYKIVTEKALDFITTPGSPIVKAMIESVANQPSFENKLYAMVKKADHHSCEKDHKRVKHSSEHSGTAVPVEGYVTDSIKMMNTEGTWGLEFANHPPLIYLDDTLYLTAKGVKRVNKHLEERKIAGMPWSQKQLTQELVDKKLAEERITLDEEVTAMWPLMRNDEDRVTWCIRLTDWHIIFADQPEENKDYRIVSDVELVEQSAKEERNKTQEAAQKTTSTKSVPSKHKHEAERPTPSESAPDSNVSHGKPEKNTSNADSTPKKSSNVSHRKPEEENSLSRQASENIENISHGKSKQKTASSHAEPSKEKGGSKQVDIQDNRAKPRKQKLSVKEKNRKLEEEAKTIQRSKDETIKHEVKALLSKTSISAKDINKDGNLSIDWQRLDEALVKKEGFLESISDALVKNLSGSYHHIQNGAPSILIRPPYFEIKSVETKKKQTPKKPGKAQKDKPKQKSKPKPPRNETKPVQEMKQHRKVPKDFDPLNPQGAKKEVAINQGANQAKALNVQKYNESTDNQQHSKQPQNGASTKTTFFDGNHASKEIAKKDNDDKEKELVALLKGLLIDHNLLTFYEQYDKGEISFSVLVTNLKARNSLGESGCQLIDSVIAGEYG